MGGRLSFFADQWEKLTDDKWILAIIRTGYKPDFHTRPPLTNQPWQRIATNPRIADAIEALLLKNAIRSVNPAVDGPGFYSHFFLVPKKSGGFRPILNLTALNKFVVKRSFRMESNRTVLAAVEPHEWLVSIDLKDAYFHIAIHTEFQRYFRFVANGKQYQYTALPFGLASAPRVFTQIVGIPVVALHQQAVKLHPYLDDWLLRDIRRAVLCQHLQSAWTLLVRLGFIPSTEKSSIVPSQDMAFVGMQLRTKDGVASPTRDRGDKLLRITRRLHASRVVTAHQLFVDPVRDHGFRNRYRPVGETSSAPNPTLFAGAMETEPRPIVSHSSNTPSFTFTLNVVDGQRKFSQGDTITSVPSRPISVHGCLPPRVGGTSRSPSRCRDVVDTTPAVPHQLARTTGGIFIPQTVRGSCNQPPRVSQYRQHDGGCLHQQNGGDAFPNPVLHVVGPDVLVYAPRDNTPCQTPTGQKEPHSGCVISQPPSSSNRMDTSTGSSQSGVSPLGNPHDGLVCDVRESQTPTVRLPHPRSSGNGGGRAINTLGRDGRIRVPPDPVNPSRSEQDSERGHGSNNDSTPMAEQIMVSSAVGSDSRSTPRTSVSSGSTVTRSRPDPSGPKSVPFTRIQVVEQSLSTQGFSRAAAAVIARPQRASTLATYEHKWQKFSDWCNGRKINPLNINESQLADFLLHLFTIKKFAPRSIAVYRTAISATIKNLGGEDFGHNSRLSAMIKHFMVERPPTRKLVPQWSLSLVLRALREPPFEPMDSISFKALTYKTVFLLALASGRRRSELHALGVSDGLVKLSKTEVVLRTTPGFLAKNQVAGSVATPITIKALSNLTGSDPQEVTLCPVRAIRWYLSRTKSRRDGNMRFFLPLSKKADCSAADISKWICGTISWAHSECSEHQRGLARVSAHEVRAIATSAALLSGVPLDEILQAGTWRSSNSFVSFYLRDMASELDGLHSLGPISVSQSII